MFQLPRIAVHVYRALVQLLYENPYEPHAPLRFDEEANRELSDVLSCFQEASRAAASVGPQSGKPLHKVLLDETLAILLATAAFEELSPIRKVWNLDLRLKGLSNVTALQLFFIYIALDNCESTDPAFHRARLAAEHRVNLALQHTQQFANAFGCDPKTPMVASRHTACAVTRALSHGRRSSAETLSRDASRWTRRPRLVSPDVPAVAG
ncbi:hypothetical protein HPB48_023771 [Haemaphysalis longicornis]|uniref:Peptidase M13 C-terminal domain-containing protein n=1 Tax=Haemaphysalis longicornis TaxID=44386 RepID=A0A9J6H7E6_HAELO|nr:hypothetical protein HPB48_023771 [Haemaphysalis longicornis]